MIFQKTPNSAKEPKNNRPFRAPGSIFDYFPPHPPGAERYLDHLVIRILNHTTSITLARPKTGTGIIRVDQNVFLIRIIFVASFPGPLFSHLLQMWDTCWVAF